MRVYACCFAASGALAWKPEWLTPSEAGENPKRQLPGVQAGETGRATMNAEDGKPDARLARGQTRASKKKKARRALYRNRFAEWRGVHSRRVMPYLEPRLVFVVPIIVVLCPAAATVHGLSLAGWCILICVGNGWPLPVLHLDDGGWMSRHRGGRSGNRHGREEGGRDEGRWRVRWVAESPGEIATRSRGEVVEERIKEMGGRGG